MSTKIEWTDKTWNPIIGCSHISPACDHCYAERMAGRLACNPKATAEYQEIVNHPVPEKKGWTWNGKTALVESVLDKPLHWRKPCRVFVGSMTDLFHPATPFEWLDKVFAVMALRPQITFQLLTKRPERMRKYLTQFSVEHYHQLFERTAFEMYGEEAAIQVANSMNNVLADGYNIGWPFRNIWLGVTVENQAMADQRIPILLDTPAAVRFVSVEPMLEGINLNNGDMIKGLDWVICGGETGPGARRMEEGWVQWLHGQCLYRGVPFFFKKWGNSGGEQLDGQILREFPATFGGEVGND